MAKAGGRRCASRGAVRANEKRKKKTGRSKATATRKKPLSALPPSTEEQLAALAEEGAAMEGRPSMAQALVELRVRAVALSRVAFGSASPAVTASVCQLAQAYLAAEMPAQAHEHASRAMQRVEAAKGASRGGAVVSRELVVNAHAAMGAALLRLGDADLASTHLDQATELNVQAHGEDAPSNAPLFADAASARARQGRLEEAVELWTRVWEIKEASVGMAHPDMVEVYLGLARCHYQAGDDDKAREAAGQALDVADGAGIALSRDVADAAAIVAASLRREGRHAESVAHSERALSVLCELDGRDAPAVLHLRREAAAAHVVLENFELAAAQLRLVLASQERAAAGGTGRERVAIALTRKRLGEVYCLAGHDRRALLEFHMCREPLRRRYGRQHRLVDEVRVRILALEDRAAAR